MVLYASCGMLALFGDFYLSLQSIMDGLRL